MALIGRDDLANDTALADNAGRVARVAELDQVIGEWTRHQTVDEVLAALDAASVPAGRIYTIEDIAKDPHYQARGMLKRFAWTTAPSWPFPVWCPNSHAHRAHVTGRLRVWGRTRLPCSTRSDSARSRFINSSNAALWRHADMQRIYFNEVVTRDGFQIEPEFIATDVKVGLIDALSRCGYAKIESPRSPRPSRSPCCGMPKR